MKKTLGSLLIVLLIGTFTLVYFNNFFPNTMDTLASATEVNYSIISSDTTWTKAGSPYDLHGPVAISPGVTLTIEPGTTVNLQDNYLQVNGTLIAKGTETEQISFNSGYIGFTALCSGWNEQTQSGSIIEYARFIGLYENLFNHRYSAQITVEGSSPKLSHIQGVASLKIVEGGGSQKLMNNQIVSLYVSGAQIISDNDIRYAEVSGTQQIINNNFGILDCTGSQIVSDNVIKDLRIIGDPLISSNEIGENASKVITNTQSITISGNATVSSNTIYDGIAVNNGSPIIWNNTVTYTPSDYYQQNIAVISLPSNGAAIVSNNRIIGQQASIPDYESLGMRPDRGPFYTFYGVSTSGDQLISNNIISGCTKASILVYGNATIQNNILNDKGIILDAQNAKISFNNFQGSDSGLYLWEKAVGTIDASNNWWGTTDTTVIDKKIYDVNDDFNLGTANYQPILTEPYSQAGPNLNVPLPTPFPTAILIPSSGTKQQTGTSFTLNFEQTLILVLFGAVAVLAVAVAVLLQKRRSVS